MPSFTINHRSVGDGHPAYIIAELSCNHCQDFEIAKRTLHAMAASGADAVKLQTMEPEGITMRSKKKDFLIDGGTLWDGTYLYDLYSRIQTPKEWHAPLQELAAELGLDFFSSPFDLLAVDFLEELDVPAYKIASFEAVDPQLIEAVARTGKPVILSTGVSQYEDVVGAIEACRGQNNDKIALLKCTSAYPAPLDSMHLAQISAIKREFACVTGLSDHSEGSLAAVLAVAAGASIIEKHFILEKGLPSADAAFSMDPASFKEMVDRIREAERALGEPALNFATKESQSGKRFARSLYAVKDIEEGEALTKDNVRSIRPGFGLPPKELPRVLGKKASHFIEAGTALRSSMFASP